MKDAPRRALARILAAPHLARLVPQLQPEALHRVIQACGLEDCGELLTLATPAQLRQLCDLDLWRPERPGRAETFDAARFGTWIEVLVETDPSLAASRLAELDRGVLTAGLARHVIVCDEAAIADYVTTDGETVQGRRFEDRLTADLGGYLIVARRTDAWDAILAALGCLETDRPDCFVEVMSAVRALSNSTPERDGLHDLLDDGDQLVYELGVGREERRHRRGYVAAAEARAFLQAARQAGVANVPGPARVAFGRVVEEGTSGDPAEGAEAPLVNLLVDAGILVSDPPSRALLAGAPPEGAALPRLRDQMRFLVDHDPPVYDARNADLAFLANTLVAGCPIQGRGFAVQEAWDAAAATCNLALDHLDAPDGFLVDHDLIRVFQTGWTILHDEVVMYAADRLAGALPGLCCRDRLIQADLDALRRELIAHLRTGTPWRARPRMDVLASLDGPAWAALLGLIDECPVRHAALSAARDPGVHAVSASAFEFISQVSTVREIRSFLESLPAAFGMAHVGS